MVNAAHDARCSWCRSFKGLHLSYASHLLLAAVQGYTGTASNILVTASTCGCRDYPAAAETVALAIATGGQSADEAAKVVTLAYSMVRLN